MASKWCAVVTGAATGVGRATAVALARRGCNVVINYSRSQDEAEQTAALVREAGGDALTFQADVADEMAVEQMIGAAIERFGRLDVLVNNAGTTSFIPLKELERVTDAVWDRIFAVNLKGAFYAARCAASWLERSEVAAIVNVASTAGLTGLGSSIPYCASKGALITLTKSLARALAPRIRVNAVCPGPIRTRWLDEHPEMIERALPLTPLGRVCEPEDVADVIAFLAFDARMMTGQAVVLDGGRTM